MRKLVAGRIGLLADFSVPLLKLVSGAALALNFSFVELVMRPDDIGIGVVMWSRGRRLPQGRLPQRRSWVSSGMFWRSPGALM